MWWKDKHKRQVWYYNFDIWISLSDIIPRFATMRTNKWPTFQVPNISLHPKSCINFKGVTHMPQVTTPKGQGPIPQHLKVYLIVIRREAQIDLWSDTLRWSFWKPNYCSTRYKNICSTDIVQKQRSLPILRNIGHKTTSEVQSSRPYKL